MTTTSANSHWTLGCISFHHRHMYIQLPQVLTSLISPFSSFCGRNFAPAIPMLQSIQLLSIRVWEERLPLKTEAKKLLDTSAFSSSVASSLPDLFSSGNTPPFIFLFWLTCLWKPSCYSLHPLPISVLASPWPSLPHLYTTVLNLYTFLKLHVLVSTAYTFFFFFFFPFSITSNSLLSHASLLFSSPDSWFWELPTLVLSGRYP